MSREILVSLRMTLATLVLTGLLYPLAVTGIAQVVLPSRANGSLVTDAKGTVVGSELIAQAFTKPGYFQPRPSAAGSRPTSSGCRRRTRTRRGPSRPSSSPPPPAASTLT
jgi:K+-transporting ATPase KdpC subunit